MIARLLPLLLMLAGLGAGVGAGLFLRPDPPAGEAADDAAEDTAEDPEIPPEFVKLNNQFVVPVVEGGRVAAMVILSLSLEVETGTTPEVFRLEPKLRDVLLQVLFDHANAGGFRGSFTDTANLVLLRRAMAEAAGGVLGDALKDVLITDIVRQDS
ncbi:MAG: hypothetical protein RIR62_3073 [Pseudomonadota bacterium]|jgi:hypothetical protein